MIEDHQSEMDDDDDDDLRRDDQYKQVCWSGVSHINMCEGIGVEITKECEGERDEDGWEGRRKGSEGGELGEYSIWQGGESVVVEEMKDMRV